MDWEDRQSLKDLYLIGYPLALAAGVVIALVSAAAVWLAVWLLS